MKFTEHRDASVNMIRSYQPDLVVVNQHEITASCIITQNQIITDWAVESFELLSPEDLQILLDFKPEVLILGTGETQKFPSLELARLASKHGISIEAMSNDAACRTYNVLTTEERVVVLGLVL